MPSPYVNPHYLMDERAEVLGDLRRAQQKQAYRLAAMLKYDEMGLWSVDGDMEDNIMWGVPPNCGHLATARVLMGLAPVPA